MHCLLCVVQSSMPPQQKDWTKYVHIHQQSACLTNLLSWCTCTQLNVTTIAVEVYKLSLKYMHTQHALTKSITYMCPTRNHCIAGRYFHNKRK